MARGFASGALWGAVLGALGLGAVSLMAPLPVPPDAVQKIATPSAVPPVADESVGASVSDSLDQPAVLRDVAPVDAPAADEMGEIGVALANPTAPPKVGGTNALPTPAVPEQPVAAISAEAPVYPNPQALAPVAPEAGQAPEIKTAAPVLAQESPIAPFEAFAQPFENPDAKPLMSVILLDEGEMPIESATLDDFPYPLSIAVDVALPDAATRMAAYRAKGFEVLAAIDAPADVSQVEVTFSDALARLDQVIGVMEGTGAGFQTSRVLSDQVIGILAASGHGLVAQDNALNTMPNLARKQGVPAGHVFRVFDSDLRDPTVIRRFLDQGAFRAVQEGQIIMMGRLRPETLSALILWGVQDRATTVVLAPVSAVLRAKQ